MKQREEYKMKIVALMLTVILCMTLKFRTSSALIKVRNGNNFKTSLVTKRARSSGDAGVNGFSDAAYNRQDFSLNLKSNSDESRDENIGSNISNSDAASNKESSGGNERKRRIITPDDLNSLFDSSNDDKEYVCDEEECDDDYLKKNSDSSSQSNSAFEDDEYARTSSDVGGELDAMKELNKLVQIAQRGEGQNAAALRPVSMFGGDDDQEEDGDSYSSQDGERVDSAEYDYFNLETKLTDKRKAKSLFKTISIIDKRSAGLSALPTTSATAVDTPLTPRAVIYDPAPSARGDPMSYGAYRRSQVVDEDIKRKQAKKAKKASGPFSGVRDALNKNKPKDSKDKDNKGKGINQSDTDSFYNTIKRLGSGPVPPGTSTSTGTADAPKNKRPIQPKKGLARRNKKKIITPEDINGLFDTVPQRRKDEVNDDDNDDDDDDDEIEKMDEVDDENKFFGNRGESKISSATTSADGFQPIGSYNPMISPNEEAPKWLADADKAQKEEAKKRKQMAGRKKKKLTDDWRFWAAIIGAGGFLTAFYNVYQQTGGFGTASGPTDELII